MRVWAVLMVCWLVAGCSSEQPRYCQTDNECDSGMVCGTEDCSGIFHCLRAECACTPGGFRNPCSLPPSKCNCDHATCEQPFDSCNEYVCPGVCSLGQSCQFCVEPGGCDLAEPCLGSTCLLDGEGQAVCRPSECWLKQTKPPLCGDSSAPCGPCFHPRCENIECGQDPSTGLFCDCAVHHYCTASNHCVQASGYTLCQGDLSATADAVVPSALVGPVPTPMGGKLTEGSYDLVGQYEYASGRSEEYDRAALRIFDAGSRAEFIYDARTNTLADYDSPHRLLSVSQMDDTTLAFDVTCPDAVYFPRYSRRYTANGDDLSLFQDTVIEVYKKRP